MSRPKKSSDEPRKKIPTKWAILGLLILVAIILHQIPQTMEVTLHLLTGRISFSFPGTEDPVTVIESLPLTSLNLCGFSSLSLDVRDMREGETSLVPHGSRVTLKARSRESRFNFLGEKMRLKQVTLASGATVSIYTDQEDQVLMNVWGSQVSEVVLDVPERKFRLTVKDVVLLDGEGKEIPFRSYQPIHTLDVTSSFHNLIFEQQEQSSFALVMNFSRQIEQGQTWNITLPFIPRLKVSQLDFTRKVGNKKVSEIHRLWIEPIMRQDKSEQEVFLEIRESDVFTLQSLSLSEQGLECRLTGNTDTLRTGKDAPRKERIPSLLFSLLHGETFEKFIKVVKHIGGIVK
jgi:hypothetical protein